MEHVLCIPIATPASDRRTLRLQKVANHKLSHEAAPATCASSLPACTFVSGLPRSETTLNVDFSQPGGLRHCWHSKRLQPHVLMQTVSHCGHQSFKVIATARILLAAKSMLSSATATCSELRALTLPSCALRNSLFRNTAAPSALVQKYGIGIFSGPRLSGPKLPNRLLHTALTSGSHDVGHPLDQALTSQAVRGSRSSMAAASMQAPHAALVQQQEDVQDRTAHQQENPLHSILLQADSAAQPFMASPAEQPTRARVDYSKSQRPLQVLNQAH